MTVPHIELSHPIIRIDGNLLAPDIQVQELEVDTSLGMPDMFMIRFVDEKMLLSKDPKFALGSVVEIEASTGYGDGAVQGTLIEGEITGLELEMRENRSSFIVRGYDKSHRLNRGTHTEVYIQKKHSEIVSAIAGVHSLTADVDATVDVYQHVFQNNISDRDFIEELARLNGYQVQFQDGKLQFKEADTTSVLTLSAGYQLYQFNARITGAGQVNKVVVKGWDPATKAAIQGTASRSSMYPTIEHSQGRGGVSAAGALGGSSSEYVYYAPQAIDSTKAEHIAQAILDQINEGHIEADGVSVGHPDILAGKTITIEKAGQFSGDYLVTSAIHTFSADDYEVQFRVEGLNARSMGDLITGDSGLPGQQYGGGMWTGVVPAIVTNNVDDNDMGRVKVKFPWLDEGLESTWARLVGVGSSTSSGIQWYPAVDDEVLVAFEKGDFNRPYVLGSMWNGTNTAPHTARDATADGDDIRVIQTPAGHIIRLTDKAGSEKIEIIDSNFENILKFDTANKKIEITSTGEMLFDATGDITIKSAGTINIEAGGDFNADGSNVKVAGSSSAEVSSSGTTKVKGSVVNIN